MRIEPLGTHRGKRLIDSHIDVRRGSRCVASFGVCNGLVEQAPADRLLDDFGEVTLLDTALSKDSTHNNLRPSPSSAHITRQHGKERARVQCTTVNRS